MLLRLFVKINVFVGSIVVCFVAIRSLHNYPNIILGCISRSINIDL